MSTVALPDVFGVTLADTWHSPAMGGGGIVVTFPNGWGASIVKHNGSYGGRDGLFEAMAIDTSGDLFGEPEGWLTPQGVSEFCERIAAL